MGQDDTFTSKDYNGERICVCRGDGQRSNPSVSSHSMNEIYFRHKSFVHMKAVWFLILQYKKILIKFDFE